uniref:Nuclear transport factor 2 (NTF2) family protein with RNA binding (RRM-RBD-RNP motifs) domain n=1 Tax=Zea mays TaxID=4577 RepID=A0A804UEN3_MAIZE
MALEDGSPATFTPQVIANAFVKQYYQTLRYAREDAYKFYNDKSILGRTDSNGKMICVTTIDDIKEQLVSTDCADCLIEIETVDAQPSHVDGVIILVAGYFTTAVVKQKFIQSFFLAPQENSGYYVLNDTFRLTGISFEVKVVAANHDNKSTQITTLPNEPEIDSFKESEVPGVPPAGNILVNDGVISTSANVVSPVKNDPVVETCVKVVNEDVVKIPVAAPASTPVTAEEVVNKDFVKIPESAPALPSSVEKADPAPRAPVEKEVTRKTYASVVKIPREDTQPAPAARPSKPNLNIKMVQNTEKNVSSPSKPAHATVNALPGDKGVPKNKSPDEPGYSIFVKNLPFEATVEMVEQEFSKFGAIKSGGVQVKCQPDQFCFGFVEFESQQSMLAAIEASRVYFGTRESYVEEKRTKTRVVDGVITRGDDNGNGGGGRFHSGRGGGYYGDGYKRQWGGQNNGYYNGADNMRNDYSGRVRGPQGNGHPQNGHGYHQNGHGYYSGNGYQQRRPNSNGNGLRVERNNGFRQQGPASA